VALSEKTDKKCKSEDKKPEFNCAVQKTEPERSLGLELGRILGGINFALAGTLSYHTYIIYVEIVDFIFFYPFIC
jgi:hypothetical protein